MPIRKRKCPLVYGQVSKHEQSNDSNSPVKDLKFYNPSPLGNIRMVTSLRARMSNPLMACLENHSKDMALFCGLMKGIFRERILNQGGSRMVKR